MVKVDKHPCENWPGSSRIPVKIDNDPQVSHVKFDEDPRGSLWKLTRMLEDPCENWRGSSIRIPVKIDRILEDPYENWRGSLRIPVKIDEDPFENWRGSLRKSKIGKDTWQDPPNLYSHAPFECSLSIKNMTGIISQPCSTFSVYSCFW
jgi:hypothetical protein